MSSEESFANRRELSQAEIDKVTHSFEVAYPAEYARLFAQLLHWYETESEWERRVAEDLYFEPYGPDDILDDAAVNALIQTCKDTLNLDNNDAIRAFGQIRGHLEGLIRRNSGHL